MAPFQFDHETLDCYRLAVEVGRWFQQVRWPAGTASLRDQGRRAAGSVILNIAEGHMHADGHRARHFRAALCSAAEACAVLDMVDVRDGRATQEKLRRIGLMVRGLSR